MFWVAGHLLDHADMHVLSVAVAGALEAVPEQQRGHNRHNHELDHNAHFDFYQNKSNYWSEISLIFRCEIFR